MQRGVDISHWNPVVNLSEVKKAGYQFCFIKCTEGTGYLDPTYKTRKEQVRKAGMLFGAYHFGRGTDAKKEAEWFLKNVGELQPGEIVVLDYELYILKDPAKWCLEWLKHVESKLGFKPLLYTYHGLIISFNWKVVADGNYGLWAARYSVNDGQYHPEEPPTTGPWPFVAIHQYTSRGRVPGLVGNIDLNHTNMSMEQLKKYGKPGYIETCKKCLIHCPK